MTIPPPPSASRTDRPARWFVYFIIAACAAAAGWLVNNGGVRAVPLQDEYFLLAQYARAGCDPLVWAFDYHNDHRYPLAKLLWLGVVQAGGYDFRLPMFGTVAVLTSSAVLLVWAVWRRRGQASFADALLPVLMLHWGHGCNLLFGYQLGWAVLGYGLCGWVWAAGRVAAGGRAWGVWAVGGFGSLVVVGGGFGLVFAPLLVLWMAWVAWLKRTRAVLLPAALFIAAWVSYSAWVALTPNPLLPAPPPRDHSPRGLVAHTMDYLVCGLGTEVSMPARPLVWWAVGGWYLAAIGLALGRLAVRLRARATGGWMVMSVGMAAGRRGWLPDPFALAVVFTLVGTILIGGVLAWVRGYGMAERFVSPSAVGLAVGWVAITGRRVQWPMVVAGLIAAAALIVLNFDYGKKHGYYQRIILLPFARDLADGTPPVFLEGRYGWSLSLLTFDQTGPYLTDCRDAKVGPFAAAGRDPAYTTAPVPLTALPWTFDTRDPARTTYRLPDPPAPVVGVIVSLRPTHGGGWNKLVLRWRDETGAEMSAFILPSERLEAGRHPIPVSGRPTDLRLGVEESSVQDLKLDGVEWMLGGSP